MKLMSQFLPLVIKGQMMKKSKWFPKGSALNNNYNVVSD